MGACASFKAPDFEVQGKTDADQDWTDGQVEAGVRACGWKRPKPRPAHFGGA